MAKKQIKHYDEKATAEDSDFILLQENTNVYKKIRATSLGSALTVGGTNVNGGVVGGVFFKSDDGTFRQIAGLKYLPAIDTITVTGMSFSVSTESDIKLNAFDISISGKGPISVVTETDSLELKANNGSIRLTTGMLGFYGASPVARQTLSTGSGATVDDVIVALQNLGLAKQ